MGVCLVLVDTFQFIPFNASLVLRKKGANLVRKGALEDHPARLFIRNKSLIPRTSIFFPRKSKVIRDFTVISAEMKSGQH
jgi:hypothetical protein